MYPLLFLINKIWGYRHHEHNLVSCSGGQSVHHLSEKNLIGLFISYGDYANATVDSVTSQGDPIKKSNPNLPLPFEYRLVAYVLTVLILTMHPLNVLCKEIQLWP